MADHSIRALRPEDLPAVKRVIDAGDLFPSEMLDAMVATGFDDPASGERWVTCVDPEPVAVAFYAPQELTDGTWNLYLAAVHPEHQRRGIGAALLAYVEQDLRDEGARMLVIETSSLDTFEGTRAFYAHNRYEREGTVRDFYATGDDKIVFRKLLDGDQD